MFESFEIFGITVYTYSICMCIGVMLLAGLFFFRLRKIGIDSKTVDIVTIVALIAGLFAYLGARFFDSLWHCIDIATVNGEFILEDFKLNFNIGGITFSGAIVGSFPAFLLIYPLVIKKEKYQSLFYLDQTIPGILIAHSLGRIGCFLGGCCWGAETDSFLGIYYPPAGAVVHPTQLYEAVFLFVCFIIFFFFLKKNLTEKYLITYGIWRFFIEYLRDDNRGASPIGFLTPSQFMSIIMIIGAIIIYFLRKRYYNKELLLCQSGEKEPHTRYYKASYKGLFKGLFNKCNCDECNTKMKLTFKSKISNENEIEFINNEHLIYKCPSCQQEKEISPVE